jgi:O-antigen ligase
VITFAAVNGIAPKLGVVLVALFAAAALIVRAPRPRAAATLGALVLAPVLLLADIWHSPQLGVVHRHPLVAVVAAVVAVGAVGLIALALSRRPALVAPLVVLALPFRVPIEAGGSTSNLLVPLYLVVAAGTLATAVPALAGWRSAPVDDERSSGWIERLLALYVVLYALQSVYSSDFEKALQQTVFFYVPFALLFVLLRRLDWTPRLVRTCMLLVVVLALVFAAIGFVEYATKTLLLNPKLIAANEVHTYFTVNSVFFDPDVFGRFLALVMIGLAVPLLFGRNTRDQIEATVVLAILWVALVLTLSRSSLAALLVGLGTLAALRWKASRMLLAGAVVVAIGAAAIVVSPRTFGLNQGINNASSGRANLVSGGVALFGQRPLWGYGSGSFATEYSRHHRNVSVTLSASHTIAITIAAEQGLLGEAAYVALVLVAAVTLLRGARKSAARAGIAAAFLALAFHALLYADFLEDPFSWTLLAVGAALAAASRAAPRPPGRAPQDTAEAVPA